MNEDQLLLLDNEIWQGGVEQITIDFVEEAIVEFEKGSDFNKDALGAFLYKLSNVLHVFDPFFKKDIRILEDLQRILEYRLIEKTKIDITNKKTQQHGKSA